MKLIHVDGSDRLRNLGERRRLVQLALLAFFLLVPLSFCIDFFPASIFSCRIFMVY